MKIFTRYVGKQFLGPFFFGLGAFALLIFLGDLFDKMAKLAASPAPPALIVQYLLLQLPYWAVRVVPMATLLAVLFAVSDFARSGEFIAVQASGFEPGKFFRPLLGLALAAGFFAFIAQETVLPWCYRRAQRLWTERIHPEWEWDKYQNVLLTVGLDLAVTADEFRVKEGLMERPVLDRYDDRGIVHQLDAAWARYDSESKVWRFEKGVERSFSKDGSIASETPFLEKDSELVVHPRDLRPREKSAESLTYLEARKEVALLRSRGQPAHQLETGMHAKLAYPFVNLILCALGIPIALRLRRANKPVAFAAALALCFTYIWFIEMGWYLGKAGRIAPLTAAWLANGFFGALALVGWRWTEA